MSWVALMLVEILHTVRIFIRSHVLVTEPGPGDRLDCVDSADAGDKPGTGHPHQTRRMVDRGRVLAFFALL